MTSHFFLWSNERRQWWRENSAGYTASLDHAGLYTVNDARNIVVTGGPPGLHVAVHNAYAEAWDTDHNPDRRRRNTLSLARRGEIEIGSHRGSRQ